MFCIYFIETDEISRQNTTFLFISETCHWLIIVVTMTTPISSRVNDKDSIFTARGEFLAIGKILVSPQYLYNKNKFMQSSVFRFFISWI